MTSNALLRAATSVAILAAGATTGGAAQMTAADSHHAGATLAQATPPAAPGGVVGQGQRAQPSQPSMMPPGMGQGMMGGVPMMGGMMPPGMMGQMPMMGMRRHTMKMMIAIADTDGDGALSFEEVTAIHKRIFDSVDVNKDGKVTAEEFQAFMQE
jgi:hypothetical protein